VDESKKVTVKMPAATGAVDDALRREILDPIMTAIASSAEETNGLVERCIHDQIGIRAEVGQLRAEVEALKGRGVAWDNADAGQARAIVDGIAEAKRIASETKADVEATLEAAKARHAELAASVGSVESKCDAIKLELDDMKTDIAAQVLDALGAHVVAIETAANKLTKTPQVRTAATVGGAFAGSAVVAAAFEIAKHFF